MHESVQQDALKGIQIERPIWHVGTVSLERLSFDFTLISLFQVRLSAIKKVTMVFFFSEFWWEKLPINETYLLFPIQFHLNEVWWAKSLEMFRPFDSKVAPHKESTACTDMFDNRETDRNIERTARKD